PHSMAVATATVQAIEAQLRCRMRDEDSRLVARYGDRLTAGSEPRALVTPSGRVIASQPDGWLGAPRLPLPAGGGRLPLSGGALLYAEVLGCDEAYVVRADRSPRPGPARRAVTLHLLGRDCGEAEIAGRTVPLRLRHSEMLALLCAEPDGL